MSMLHPSTIYFMFFFLCSALLFITVSSKMRHTKLLPILTRSFITLLNHICLFPNIKCESKGIVAGSAGNVLMRQYMEHGTQY